MKFLSRISLFAAILAMSFLSSCNKEDGDDDDKNPPAKTLYEKLGGTTMVQDPNGGMIEQGRLNLRAVVDSTIFVIAADADMAPFFEVLLSEVGNGNTSNLVILSKNLTDFFCVATGAENFSYNGLSMKDAHDPSVNARMGMTASNEDFDNFVADVVVGAQQNGVSNELIQEVGALLETVRADVVQE